MQLSSHSVRSAVSINGFIVFINSSIERKIRPGVVSDGHWSRVAPP